MNYSHLADENDRICTPEEISQRKIYKAKRLTRPGDVHGNRLCERGRFRIIESLNPPPDPVRPVDYSKIKTVEQPKRSEDVHKNGNSEKSSLLEGKSQENISNTKKVEQKPIFSKNQETTSPFQAGKGESKPTALFGQKIPEKSGPSVFLNKASAEEKKNTVSIFGKPLQSSAPQQSKTIFDKKIESKTEEKKVETTKIQNEPVVVTEKTPEKETQEKIQNKAPIIGSKTATTTLFGKKIDQPSFTSGGIFAKKPEPPAPSTEVRSIEKKEEKIEHVRTANIFGKKDEMKTTPNIGLFGKKEDKQGPKIIGITETKPETKTTESDTTKPNLFGSANKGISLFGKKSDDTEKKEQSCEPKKLGLFTDPPKPAVGLFNVTKTAKENNSSEESENSENNNKQKEPEKKDEGKKFTSLFGTQKKDDSKANTTAGSVGIFGANKAGPLFGGTKTLFGGPSLFSGVHQLTKTEDQRQSFISSGTKKEDGEGEGDEEGNEKDDDKPKFITVSKDPYTKIFNRPVERFKTNKNDKGNGHISIETGEENNKKFVLFNFRNPIGKTLFTGQIFPKCKRAEVIDKLGKIQVKVIIIEKDNKNTFKAVPSIITFLRTDDKTEFDAKWNEAKAYLGNSESK